MLTEPEAYGPHTQAPGSIIRPPDSFCANLVTLSPSSKLSLKLDSP
ncbi:rCG30319 [Rattus norvegicus]|uniref:RCG30319 n=1 Tax=Rattus norvegicus TaxID=10116 RepID=A6IME8_RAT|nr:rCG30319 [Rattus norvegicus]